MRFAVKKKFLKHDTGAIRAVYQVIGDVGCDRKRARAIAARLSEKYKEICKDVLNARAFLAAPDPKGE